MAIPAANSVIEPEFWLHAPPGVSFHFTRLPSQPFVTESALRQRERRVNDAIRLLTAARVDAVMIADMVTNFFMPSGWSSRRTTAVARKYGVVCVSAWSAMRDALEALGVQTFALGSPYPASIHDRAVRFFEANGYTISAAATLDIAAVADVPQVSGARLYHLVASLDPGPCRTVVLLATDLPTFAEIADIEQRLGVTIVTSNQVLLWRALHAIAAYSPRRDLGRLFLIGSVA